MLLSGFLAAFAAARQQEQQGAWSGAGFRPVPGQPCQVGCDCTSQRAPRPQHGMATALSPTARVQLTYLIPWKDVSSHLPGFTRFGNRGFSSMELKKNNKVSGLKRWAG